MVILDEAHFIKDYKTARYKSSEKIARKAKRLILLSGTPALSRPIELYSQISLIAPKLFRSVSTSKSVLTTYILKTIHKCRLH